MPFLDAFRRPRHAVWLALLAACLQWLAASVGAFRSAQPPDAVYGIFGAADICHNSGDAGSGPLEHPADSPHCPFCLLALASATMPLAGALSFPHPEPAVFFVPAADAYLQPCVPDLRHAPKHAPPFSFV